MHLAANVTHLVYYLPYVIVWNGNCRVTRKWWLS